MSRFWLLAIYLISYSASFSQAPSLVNAADVINRGKQLYDSGKYKESIAKYLSIPKRDTGYVYMLSELSLAYIANEEFEKAIATCEEGLLKPSIYRAHFLRSQAIATDRKGDYDKAVMLFNKAIEDYPVDFILLYNLGITYYNHKAYEKATEIFFKVLSMNPFHPGSHLNLGRMSAGQGKKTHAMLSLGMYLGVSNTDNERLVFLEKFLANQFQEEGSLTYNGPNAFDKLDQIIRAKIAMDKNYKSKIDIDAAIVRQYQMLFDQLESAVSSANDPWSAYYVPIYKALKEKDMIEPFIFHILKSANIDLVRKWHQKNGKKLEAFYEVTNTALKKKREVLTMPSLGCEKPTQAWYYSSNRIEAIGDEDAQGTKKGRWIFFKPNFERSADGMYSPTGEKIGTWKYFHEDGTTSSVEHYETGEVNVFNEGVLTQHFFLKNNEIQGNVEIYNNCGILYENLVYDKGRRHGPGKSFYSSGKTKAIYEYDSNKVVGKYTNFFETGKIKNILTYKADKLDGQCIENFANGKCKSTGHYLNDELTGLWKYYHANGRIESSGNYKAGLATGEWNFYTERGALYEKRNFDNEGKLHGENAFYHEGKIYCNRTYKNGLLISIAYFDMTGKELGKFAHTSGTFKAKQYYPTGQLAGEGSFKMGNYQGIWQYFFPEGSKRSEFTYEDGIIQGDAQEYFRSGGRKFSFHYKDGEFDGKFEEYFPHGQLKQAGWFGNGNRQQQWLSYYPDGVLESDYYYLNGELLGLCLDYSTTGKLFAASEYEAGRLENIMNYSKIGEVLTRKVDQSKQTIFETKYTNGKHQSKFEATCGEYTKITKWFPNGEVFYTYNLLSGQKEGEYQFNAINGTTVLKGSYINGLEEGLWNGFYVDGKLDYTGVYRLGKHDSTWTYNFPNGKTAFTSEFKNGERNGVAKYFGPDGSPLIEKLYLEGDLIAYREIEPTEKQWIPFTGNAVINIHYKDGRKAYEETYKNGVLSGSKRIYYSTGNLYSEYEYELGDYTGDYRIHHPNGKLMEKGTYKLDERHGPVERYLEDGSLLMVENYVMGEQSGQAVFYDKGKKKLEYSFYGGLPHE